MDPITARRLRLKHTASAAESAAASLENLRINVVVHHCESEFSEAMPEEFSNALADEVHSMMKRVREIYADLDHLALTDEPEGAFFADCKYRLAHSGAEMPVEEAAAAA